MKMRSLSLIFMAALVVATLSCSKKNPRVVIETPRGNIVVELYMDKAPVTAGHFLDLVERGIYEGTSFYRVVRTGDDKNPVNIQVVQGGVGDAELPSDIQAIPHENTDQTGIKHLDGVISMARRQPGTAKSEFFICVNDQPELDIRGRRNPDGQGFAAFGMVVEGIDVVRAIWSSPIQGERLNPPVRIHKMYVK
jgi:peptidyl-prolyl cis-trans isomerase A (cyclophilin A)